MVWVLRLFCFLCLGCVLWRSVLGVVFLGCGVAVWVARRADCLVVLVLGRVGIIYCFRLWVFVGI